MPTALFLLPSLPRWLPSSLPPSHSYGRPMAAAAGTNRRPPNGAPFSVAPPPATRRTGPPRRPGSGEERACRRPRGGCLSMSCKALAMLARYALLPLSLSLSLSLSLLLGAMSPRRRAVVERPDSRPSSEPRSAVRPTPRGREGEREIEQGMLARLSRDRDGAEERRRRLRRRRTTFTLFAK